MDKSVETMVLTKTTYHLPNAIGIPLVVLALLLFLVPFFRIWSRTGHSGFWSLLMVVPFVNLVSLWVLAFKKWPVLDTDGKGLR